MLILASASPRRHELLLAAQIPHTVQPANIDESRRVGELPGSYVQRLASEKARAVSLVTAADIILGADTVVTLDGELFTKPENDDDAARMLRQLSGRRHLVQTAICLRTRATDIVDLGTTEVEFRKLDEAEIHDYIQSREGPDKAGAYAIQGRASRFVLGVQGSYHNVVGLPVSLLYGHLRGLGYL